MKCKKCGKNFEIEEIKTNKCDLVFTDPPYNVNYENKFNCRIKHRNIKNDNISRENFKLFLRNIIKNMMEVCNGSFYIFMGNMNIGTLMEIFQEAGGHFQGYIVWVKNRFVMNRLDYQSQYESILYGWNKNNKKHYFVDDRTKSNVWYDVSKRANYKHGKTILSVGGVRIELDGKVTGRILKNKRKLDIWNYNNPTTSDEHPTMKPISLCSEAIQNSCLRNDIVLDLFAGSGSTLIACEKINRKCFGMEIDPTYCQVILDRWEKYTGKKILKI